MEDPLTAADVQGLGKAGEDVPDPVKDVDVPDLEIDNADRGHVTADENPRSAHANHVPNLAIEKVEKRMRNLLRSMRPKKKRLKKRTKKKHLHQQRRKVLAKMTARRKKTRTSRTEIETRIEIGTATEIATEIATAKDVALVPRISDVVHVQRTEIGSAANALAQGTEKGAAVVTKIRKNRQVLERSRETTIRKRGGLNRKTNLHRKKALTLKPKIWTFRILLKLISFVFNTGNKKNK